ncbi:hypothetical protein NPIL_678131 [Nephila pilipes]|uniref:Uncharacterized protein n=1 Tax=Nephila pilipes TaxID=299642 RepID=A0A8X6MBI6_NEPPI|nr:hypothetical protein NPIL_678131 [Nephila pilipes]
MSDFSQLLLCLSPICPLDGPSRIGPASKRLLKESPHAYLHICDACPGRRVSSAYCRRGLVRPLLKLPLFCSCVILTLVVECDKDETCSKKIHKTSETEIATFAGKAAAAAKCSMPTPRQTESVNTII